METVDLYKYLDDQLVLFLDTELRDTVLEQLVEAAYNAGKCTDKQKFLQAILQRENIVSTCVGMGVAIPHAKMVDLESFFVVIGILKKGAEWQAPDESKVRIVFMIGGPDDKQTEYLQILSKLTHTIKNDETRKKMLTLKSPQDIMLLFK